MPTYVALLRGINVGGHKKVPMADLKKMMEKMGLKNVKTLLASGNVVFDAIDGDTAKLTKKMEEQFTKTFGFSSSIILRSKGHIDTLLKAAPFKGIKVTPATRLYVTFLSSPQKGTLTLPYQTPDKLFKILSASATEVFSVATVSPEGGTVEAMGILEKAFGKNVTTRNWNTVEKLVK